LLFAEIAVVLIVSVRPSFSVVVSKYQVVVSGEISVVVFIEVATVLLGLSLVVVCFCGDVVFSLAILKLENVLGMGVLIISLVKFFVLFIVLFAFVDALLALIMYLVVLILSELLVGKISSVDELVAAIVSLLLVKLGV
jgi:hypothetical protein